MGARRADRAAALPHPWPARSSRRERRAALVCALAGLPRRRATVPVNSDTQGTLTVEGRSTASNVIAIIFAPGAAVGGQVRDAAVSNVAGNYLEAPNPYVADAFLAWTGCEASACPLPFSGGVRRHDAVQRPVHPGHARRPLPGGGSGGPAPDRAGGRAAADEPLRRRHGPRLLRAMGHRCVRGCAARLLPVRRAVQRSARHARYRAVPHAGPVSWADIRRSPACCRCR